MEMLADFGSELVAGMAAELILSTRIGWKPSAGRSQAGFARRVCALTFNGFAADGQAVGFLNLRLLLNSHLLKKVGT